MMASFLSKFTMPEKNSNEKKIFSKKPVFLKENNRETKDPSLFNCVCFWTRPCPLYYKGIFWVVVVLCKISGFVVSLVSVGEKSFVCGVLKGEPNPENKRKRNPDSGNFFRKKL